MRSYENTLEQIAATKKKWLVTGAAGFIGSHLVEALLKLNQSVVGLDNLSTGKTSNLDEVLTTVGPARAGNFSFIKGDIRSIDTCLTACRGSDVVLHQAALGSVPRSLIDPLETNSANIDGFLNVLTAARDEGVGRVVYAASSSTYGDGKRLPMVESDIGKPLSPYALTKYVNELYADVYARCFGLKSIGLRYFNVFGPRQDPDGDYAAVIPKWIGALLDNKPVHINGDGTTARDFCFVGNVVQANLLAATTDNPSAENEVFNVALGAQTTLDELFQMIRLLLAPTHPDAMTQHPRYREFRPGDIRISQADISKAQNLLGYHPVWEVREGMKWAINWYLEREASSQPEKPPIRSTSRTKSRSVEVAA